MKSIDKLKEERIKQWGKILNATDAIFKLVNKKPKEVDKLCSKYLNASIKTYLE